MIMQAIPIGEVNGDRRFGQVDCMIKLMLFEVYTGDSTIYRIKQVGSDKMFPRSGHKAGGVGGASTQIRSPACNIRPR